MHIHMGVIAKGTGLCAVAVWLHVLGGRTCTCMQIGDNDNFPEVLAKVSGPAAVEEWKRLLLMMRPLSKAAAAIPPTAFRCVSAGRLPPPATPPPHRACLLSKRAAHPAGHQTGPPAAAACLTITTGHTVA